MDLSNPRGKPNRLANEKSPYLLQHAQNPVDWYPWGDEALKKAETEDKPIFLSIGYSTCHWCHVMERESFEDEEVASLLNKEFVSVKVDREERPDIDSLYMKACMAMTGSGGWPLTVILTPEKQPFFAGTYIPKRSRGGRLGLVDLLTGVTELWKNDRAKLITTAERVTGYLIEYMKTPRGVEEPTETVLDEAFIKLLDGFDRANAGFGTSPKFPSPHNLLFLLRYWKRKGIRQALEMVEQTLQKMRLGGIYDQVGFGFHRYATDSAWLVPHFEKMLYDQAMLAFTYIEAYQATGNNAYLQTAEEVFEYIAREMTDIHGGFFSAEDADSEGHEGKFYLWTESEIEQALGEDASLIMRVFNISKKGNFLDPLHRDETGMNILHLTKPLRDLASELGMTREELAQILKKARQRLFTVRERRVHPLKDDKILTGWNGLVIVAMAKRAQLVGSQRYVQAAENAVAFLLENLQGADGRLVHRYREGEAMIDGYLDDYAFLIWGLIELYEATFKVRYLAEAIRRQEEMIAHFWDEEEDGFFFTSDTSETILVRGKEFHDGAYPSGNSVALLNLVRLARMTGNVHYEEKAARLATTFLTREAETSSPNTMFLAGLDFVIGPAYEVVIVGDPASRETKEVIKAVRTGFLPNKVVLFKEPNNTDLAELASFTKEMKSIDRKTTTYVCQNFSCSKPITDTTEVLKTLGL